MALCFGGDWREDEYDDSPLGMSSSMKEYIRDMEYCGQRENQMSEHKYKMPDGARQVRYLCMEAHYAGIKNHPEIQMKKLGFKLIAAVPQTLYDEWWFTVEDSNIELPEYIIDTAYDFGYWHGNGCGIYFDYLVAATVAELKEVEGLKEVEK